MTTDQHGVWRPWRHADYCADPSPYQGWWRNIHTGEVIAVLSEAKRPSTGKPRVQAAKYNFNSGARGNGVRLLIATLERDYRREPDDLNPPNLA